MPQGPRVIAALDVGNHRVLALIAELSENDEMVIRGVGLAPSGGMRSGQVVQMKPVVAAIKAAAEEAELMAKLPAEKVVASVAGIFVSGRLTRAAISMGARDREVTMADLEALHDAVRRQPLPAGHTVLNVVSPTYALDDQDGLLDPQSMVGRHLAVDAYVLACQESPVRTIEKAINEAGLEVEEFLFAPVAAANATLTGDERRLGAILIDIGYGSTSYAAFSGDKLLASGCFPIGGNKVNDDLVHRFQTTAAGAEKAKREAGTMLLTDVGEEETISVPTIEGRGSPRDLAPRAVQDHPPAHAGDVRADRRRGVASDPAGRPVHGRRAFGRRRPSRRTRRPRRGGLRQAGAARRPGRRPGRHPPAGEFGVARALVGRGRRAAGARA